MDNQTEYLPMKMYAACIIDANDLKEIYFSLNEIPLDILQDFVYARNLEEREFMEQKKHS